MNYQNGVNVRRGVHTSEFLVMALNALGNIIAASAHLQGTPQAAKYSAYGIVAYAISRGLSKLTVGNPEAPNLYIAPPPPVPTQPVAAPTPR